jgi:NADH dehydrogenase [ubiquinone] 1 alpha subcomplex assembly factor 5
MVETADIVIFDRMRLKQARAKIRPGHDFLIQWAQDQLNERLKDIKRSFPEALHIGPSPYMNVGGIRVAADEEFLPFKDNSLDLVTSNLTLHSTNDLPGTLLQIRRALKPDGLFIAAMLGGETLHELRTSLMQAEMELKGGASPRVFPFADKPQMGGLMQRAGYALPVVDSEIVTVTYESIFKLMHDLRFMGESNIIAKRSKIYPGRDFFMKAAEYYSKNFSDPDGRIRASFEIIFLIGWAPHKSQQQPLRPGSAKTRLADVLGVDEIKTGEKTAP